MPVKWTHGVNSYTVFTLTTPSHGQLSYDYPMPVKKYWRICVMTSVIAKPLKLQWNSSRVFLSWSACFTRHYKNGFIPNVSRMWDAKLQHPDARNFWGKMTLWQTLFALLSHQRIILKSVWCDFLFQSEYADEDIVELPVIWDCMTCMRRHCNARLWFNVMLRQRRICLKMSRGFESITYVIMWHTLKPRSFVKG